MRENKKKHNKIVFADKSKLCSIKKIQSKAPEDKEISREDFTTIINDERNYDKMKESIRMLKMWKSDVEINKLIKNGIKVGIEEFTKQNEKK